MFLTYWWQSEQVHEIIFFQKKFDSILTFRGTSDIYNSQELQVLELTKMLMKVLKIVFKISLLQECNSESNLKMVAGKNVQTGILEFFSWFQWKLDDF